VDSGEAECVEESGQLLDKPVVGPQLDVIGDVGSACAELVIKTTGRSSTRSCNGSR
jgi:hypothetical protein